MCIRDSARSVTLSIRSQTYVEADKAMGVSAARTFFTHFLPRLTPVTIAFTALSVSAGIIFGETLAFLGIEPVSYTHLDVYKRQRMYW